MVEEKFINNVFICSWNELEKMAPPNSIRISFVKGGVESCSSNGYLVAVHPIESIPIIPVSLQVTGKIVDISDFEGDNRVEFEKYIFKKYGLKK